MQYISYVFPNFSLFYIWPYLFESFVGNARAINESVLEIPEDEIEKPPKDLIVIEGVYLKYFTL